MPSRYSKTEPARLSSGKRFHRSVQLEWSGVPGARAEVGLQDAAGRPRRIDILIDDKGYVSVVEIKHTNWDRIRRGRVRANALRHSRQLWTYIDPYLDREHRDVCPAIIYDHVPRRPHLLEEVERILNERGIQVAWQRETLEQRRERSGMGPQTARGTRSAERK